MQISLSQFQLAASLSPALASRWYPHILSAMKEFGIDTPRSQAAFIAQIGHESGGFKALAESFNYSVVGLKATFNSRLTAGQCAMLGRQSGETVVPLERQKAIANLVYSKRYGNNAPGDGWKFRGRGLKQITFLDNYYRCGHALEIDLIINPDLLLQDDYAARSAGWFWFANNCNRYADNGDFVGLTRVINGGSNGLAERQARLVIAERVLCR
ncbi:putative endolysin [Yersinia pekkanenii]|uniref:Putative endolysin n=1 Tax=Yersinia pekkanenii TaxID=1288385 RepID=A0A0T9RIB5_9GAMM|nr:putative endolysin [Yersinia pekkanenii]